MSDVDMDKGLGGDEAAARDGVGNNPIEYTETITTGFGERLQASCWGILLGIVLFICSFPFLYWNEGRAVDRYEALNEAEAETITVSGLNIDPSNDGKLLHFSVNITNGDSGGALIDPLFGIKASSNDSLILRRNTEMYQWVEKVSTSTKKNVGGSKTTTKNYSYVKEWNSRLINSGSFKKSTDHVNPSYMEFESTKIIANPIRIGAYDLPSSLVGRLTWDVPLKDITVNDISNVELRNRAVQTGDKFYFATTTTKSPTGPPSSALSPSPPTPPLEAVDDTLLMQCTPGTSSCGLVRSQRVHLGCGNVYLSQQDFDTQCGEDGSAMIIIDSWNGGNSCGLVRGQTLYAGCGYVYVTKDDRDIQCGGPPYFYGGSTGAVQIIFDSYVDPNCNDDTAVAGAGATRVSFVLCYILCLDLESLSFFILFNILFFVFGHHT